MNMAATPMETDAGAVASPALKPPHPLDMIRTPGFPMFLAMSAAVLFLFQSLMVVLPGIWFKAESYYSHGILIPLIVAVMVRNKWHRLQAIPRQGSWWPFVFLAPVLYITWVASRTSMALTLSFLLVATIGLAIWSICGWKMAMATSPMWLYLLFGLPVWQLVIDKFTQPLQNISAKVSFELLKLMGQNMLQADSTTILLDRFEMNVGAPCSGLRTLLSLIALTAFFIYIAKLPWYANTFLAVFMIPFGILINGVRIAMIGLVGNTYGSEAGHQFHDYSGYISTLLCVFILMKICEALGWKGLE
ncbi:MAG: exosortase/archaeosortase family protein [Fimbriimonadaceae bacterium]|nr:exosortase/archaeosortase family protein [Fimbriimonadaceae bacterium]